MFNKETRNFAIIHGDTVFFSTTVFRFNGFPIETDLEAWVVDEGFLIPTTSTSNQVLGELKAGFKAKPRQWQSSTSIASKLISKALLLTPNKSLIELCLHEEEILMQWIPVAKCPQSSQLKFIRADRVDIEDRLRLCLEYNNWNFNLAVEMMNDNIPCQRMTTHQKTFDDLIEIYHEHCSVKKEG